VSERRARPTDVLLYVVDRMRLPTTTTIWAQRWRWIVSVLLRARVSATPPLPGELLPTKCFGRLGDPEQLALEGLVAGHGGASQAPPRDHADDDPAP
jgi:hypothetical protein